MESGVRMIDFLVNRLIPNASNVTNPVVRERYGLFAGGMGIFLNLCLFGAKFLAGWLTASIAVTADAFNNLSDAGSSVVTLVGLKMAGRPPDPQHPFGHGRVEYLSGLIISLAIILVGFELGRTSLDKIMHPATVDMGITALMILAASVVVKLWMAHFNRKLGKRINSAAMLATAIDSLTDAIATTAVLLGSLLAHLFHWQIDGYIGVLVAVFILYSGYRTAQESLSPLLGQAPDRAFVAEIKEMVLSESQVVGVHDLIVHDYGPGRRIISLHAEVPSNSDLLEIHDVIDQIEMRLREEFQCDATIHMDPIVVDDEEIKQLHEQVFALVKQIGEDLSMHDFRMVKGPTHTNLIFDVCVPYGYTLTDKEVEERIWDGVKSLGEHYFSVIHIDKEC